MVSMKGASEKILVEDGRAALIRELSRAGRNYVDEAFANWLHNDLTGMKQTLRLVLAEQGALNQYQTVSVLGFGAALESLSESQHKLFVSRLRWLAGREPIVDGVPAPFCADSPALFGVALGCKSLDNPEISDDVRSWLLRFLQFSHERAESDNVRCVVGIE
jgi:hypothetical protein